MTRTNRNQVANVRRECRKWTPEEDARLLRQVRSFPQNLSKCFLIVSEELGRTQLAVANHWYTQLSKKPESLCFFTASPKHVSKNRKNGMGVESNGNIWRRLMAVIRSIV
jgi:hypothetical protein